MEKKYRIFGLHFDEPTIIETKTTCYYKLKGQTWFDSFKEAQSFLVGYKEGEIMIAKNKLERAEMTLEYVKNLKEI